MRSTVRASMMTFSVTTTAGPAAWQSLRARVAASLSGGERSFVVALLGAALDVPGVASLIATLRDVREHGGTIALRANDAGILAMLATTGLDRIFAVNADALADSARPRRIARTTSRCRPGFVAATLAALFALAALLGTRAAAVADPSPAEIVRDVIARDGAMRSYEAHVVVDIRLRSFPYAAQHLVGTTYFKRPTTEVVFDAVPSYAKGFDKLYADIDDPSVWESRFDLTPAGEKTVDGHRDLVVRMVQKVRGMIDHEDVAIDVATARIDEMEWHYYNGGVISMTQQYRSVGTFAVLASQHATIHIPFVHAAADATYTNYRTNVAIDDRVFSRQPR